MTKHSVTFDTVAKIDVIRELRAMTGWGLKEAKDAVEQGFFADESKVLPLIEMVARIQSRIGPSNKCLIIFGAPLPPFCKSWVASDSISLPPTGLAPLLSTASRSSRAEHLAQFLQDMMEDVVGRRVDPLVVSIGGINSRIDSVVQRIDPLERSVLGDLSDLEVD